MEHLRLLDLARGAVLAGIWLAGVVAAFTYAAAVQTVAAILLQAEHAVVDVEHADAAHQTRGYGCLLSRTEKKTKQKRNKLHNRSLNSTFLPIIPATAIIVL